MKIPVPCVTVGEDPEVALDCVADAEGWDERLASGLDEHAEAASNAAIVTADAPIRTSEAPMNRHPLPRSVYRFAHRDAAR